MLWREFLKMLVLFYHDSISLLVWWMMEQEAGVPVSAGADGVQLPSQMIAELFFGAQTELHIDLF